MQCWYWITRAMGMNMMVSSDQPVSAASENTWAARKPGSSHGAGFFSVAAHDLDLGCADLPSLGFQCTKSRRKVG